jgi:hypothetical protein
MTGSETAPTERVSVPIGAALLRRECFNGLSASLALLARNLRIDPEAKFESALCAYYR